MCSAQGNHEGLPLPVLILIDILKNPPIVTEYNGKSILLDGATRVTALSQIGCRDVVVQVVDYEAPGMTLATWNHMLLDAPVNELFRSLRELPRLVIEQTTPENAQAALDRRTSVAEPSGRGVRGTR